MCTHPAMLATLSWAERGPISKITQIGHQTPTKSTDHRMDKVHTDKALVYQT